MVLICEYTENGSVVIKDFLLLFGDNMLNCADRKVTARI